MASKVARSAFTSLAFSAQFATNPTRTVFQTQWLRKQNGFLVTYQRIQSYNQVRLCSTSSSPDTEASVQYESGLPVLSVPLPSRREKCRFVLKPITHTLGDLLRFIQEEDKGIDHVAAYHTDGVRIAKSTPIDALLRSSFQLVLNDQSYTITAQDRVSETLSGEHAHQLSDVKNAVMHLYGSLNIEEHQLNREQHLQARLEELQTQLEPYEKLRLKLAEQAAKRTVLLQWGGLGLMGLQFGILARLTWWEYSWDIMEPVTYFVTYGTSLAMFAYYCCTKQEYVFPQVFDRAYLINMHKMAKAHNLDINEYNKLRDSIAVTEYDLKRLRDPLQLQLPVAQLAKRIPGEIKTPSGKSVSK